MSYRFLPCFAPKEGFLIVGQTDQVEQIMELADHHEVLALCGHRDENLRYISSQFGSKIVARGNVLKVIGSQDEVERTFTVLEEMLTTVRRRGALRRREVKELARLITQENTAVSKELMDKAIHLPYRKKIIRPMSSNQNDYVEAIRKSDIIFGIGPAGTGKTYLAMAMAVVSLEAGDVTRIILTRPAVEAGESLGFLPGDMLEKVNPYLRPLYDALYDMLDPEQVRKYLERGIIEVAPLAFMRGRTLNDSFIVLDEAQNTTQEQMKMFLTRLGFDSKTVITGDVTQVDLDRNKKSGLIEAEEILRKIDGIEFVYFCKEDVVRHPLVQEIIEAYEHLGMSKELTES